MCSNKVLFKLVALYDAMIRLKCFDSALKKKQRNLNRPGVKYKKKNLDAKPLKQNTAP